VKNKILLVASALFGLIFINAGLDKFFQYMPMPEDLPQSMIKLMAALMEIGWLMTLVGIIEIVGGFLLLTKRFRGLGAIIILPVMVGILLTNIFNSQMGLPIAVTLFAINLWILWENKEKYAHLIW
jgi:uncharacterized membrane protein YphA (DoxX/SURF4 family)|tara:strand:- start:36645 stop:37022 length:378 start_codon:yes stop_codon:yes gene_type:complete